MKPIMAGMLALAGLAGVACNDSSTTPQRQSYSASALPELSVAARHAGSRRHTAGPAAAQRPSPPLAPAATSRRKIKT